MRCMRSCGTDEDGTQARLMDTLMKKRATTTPQYSILNDTRCERRTYVCVIVLISILKHEIFIVQHCHSPQYPSLLTDPSFIRCTDLSRSPCPCRPALHPKSLNDRAPLSTPTRPRGKPAWRSIRASFRTMHDPKERDCNPGNRCTLLVLHKPSMVACKESVLQVMARGCFLADGREYTTVC